MRKKGAGIQAGKAPIITLTLFILVTYYVVFLLYPIGRVIYGSFFNWNPLIGSMIYIGLDNYIAAMNNSLFWESIRNTLVCLYHIGHLDSNSAGTVFSNYFVQHKEIPNFF